MALPEPCLLFLIIFFDEKWNFQAEPFPKKRKRPCGWNEYKNMWQKNGYILCPYRNKDKVIWQIRMCAGFQVLKDTEKRKGTGICHFVRGSFGSYRQVAGGQTGRQYGRLYQTDSENQEKYNICFCIIFPKKKMNNTWQYSFFNTYGLPIEMRMNIPVHERIKIW